MLATQSKFKSPRTAMGASSNSNRSAYYRFSHRTLSVEVVAYRDIQPGEEITISCA